MKRYPVASSRIAAAGWEDGTLEVEFRSGHVYEYADVPQSTYVAMIQAPSPGKFLGENIIDKHVHNRVA